MRQHKEIYRIIDESEFVDPVAYREHYTNSANRIAARLEAATLRGEIAAGDNEVRAWAIMGMNVFLGLRYGVWGDEPPEAVVAEAGRLIGQGMGPARPAGDAA